MCIECIITWIAIQEDSKNVALLSLQEGIRQRIVVEQAQWDRIDQMDKRLSKLEEQVYPKRNIFQERP